VPSAEIGDEEYNSFPDLDFEGRTAMKFLVLWHFDLTRLGPEVARAVMQMPDYAKKLGEK
jgi:hypothetical protein